MGRMSLSKKFKIGGYIIGFGLGAVFYYFDQGMGKGPISSGDLGASTIVCFVGMIICGTIGSFFGTFVQRWMSPERVAAEKQLEKDEDEAAAAKKRGKSK